MRKGANIKFLLSPVIIVILVLTLNTKVFALDPVNICNPPATYFGKIRDLFFKDIRETTVNHLTSAASDFAFNMATGTEMGTWMGCTKNAVDKAPSLGDTTLALAAECDATDPEICDGIYNQYRYADAGSPMAFKNSMAAGSLLGFGYSLSNIMENEPIPVNYAYFFQDYAQRIPVVNQTAFAQTYQQPLINEIFVLWKVMRNLAYGLMAVVILIVGLLIITRKKISQQVVVSVQYALPKIVISMILITFSYPIGAAIASVAWALYNSGPLIVESLAGVGEFATAQELFAAGLASAAIIVTGVIVALLGTAGVGMFVTVALIILVVALIIAWLAVIVKAFIVYVKMLIHIIAAPLMFVYGAIPGNDDQTVNWFKKMASYAVSLFLMGLALHFVILLAAELLFAKTGEINTFTGVFYVVMAAPLVAAFGFIFALRIPNIVDATIMGPPKRR